MLDRIATGMLNKWYAEVALLKQEWTCDDSKELVEVKVNKVSKAVEDKVTITGISRIVIGEGVEQAEEEAAE